MSTNVNAIAIGDELTNITNPAIKSPDVACIVHVNNITGMNAVNTYWTAVAETNLTLEGQPCFIYAKTINDKVVYSAPGVIDMSQSQIVVF